MMNVSEILQLNENTITFSSLVFLPRPWNEMEFGFPLSRSEIPIHASFQLRSEAELSS